MDLKSGLDFVAHKTLFTVKNTHHSGFILIQLLLCLMVSLPGGMPARLTMMRPAMTGPAASALFDGLSARRVASKADASKAART